VKENLRISVVTGLTLKGSSFSAESLIMEGVHHRVGGGGGRTVSCGKMNC